MDYNGYCVRVQAIDGYASKILSLVLVKDYESIVAMKHVGKTKSNPHYHLVIKTQVKDQAFRVRMKKIFDQAKGNEHMSIRNWDGGLDAISYLFHEEPDGTPLLIHNVSQETIEKAKARNQEVQVAVADAKGKAAWRLEDEVFAHIKNPQITQDEIAKMLILTSLRTGKYMPNDYLLKSMVTRIQFRLCNGDLNMEEIFADGQVWRIFHRYD